MSETMYQEQTEVSEPESEMALDLVRAIFVGDDSAKRAAYRRLEGVWSQAKIDDLVFDVEALFRMAAG
ncbi:MAG: hypothetical protein FJY97_16195 [candidate division Zixibacteria bacterium]|nr:hypothetical protein [candidate division Zixibacteria bacterium]